MPGHVRVRRVRYVRARVGVGIARTANDGKDVRGVPAACAFGVVGVNAAALEGLHRLLHARRLVQRVRVNRHLLFAG